MTGGILQSAPVDALFVPTQQPVFKAVRSPKKHWPKRFVSVALAAIVVLAPFPAASNHPVIWAVVIGFTGTVYSLFAADRKTRRNRLVTAMITLVAGFIGFAVLQGSALSVFASATPEASLLAAVRIASYLAFFVLVLQVAQNRRVAARLSQVLFFSIVLQGLLAMVILKLPLDGSGLFTKPAYPNAATGMFIGKNAFAGFLGMGLILGMTLLHKTRNRQHGNAVGRMRTGAVALGLLIILIALVNTQSRMGMAATLTGALCVAMMNAVSVSFMASSLVGALLVVVIYGQELLERFVTVSQSGVTRMDLYRQVFGMIRTRPLTGFGLDSFPLVFQQFHAAPVSAGFVWDKAHSTYLTLWAEAGLLAGSLPLVAGILAIVALGRIARQGGRDAQSAIAALGVMTLGGVHSLVDFSLEIQANMFVLLTIVAIGLAQTPKQKGH
ncbi:MAG: O-antigen ligase family protein [Paracoccaceae bacterium]